LVACANQNTPHTNASQFFISLDKCEWLDKKNTIFGKVVGDTIFNLSRYNDVDVSPQGSGLG
jgi:peptidyl-prolyl cis-trans isomerase SDCCAG10